MNDEALFDRRMTFLRSRIAGATFTNIASDWNKRAVEAAQAAGRPIDEAETVSVTTVRKDVDAAKRAIVDDVSRDMIRGEHRAILLDMRRAHYPGMLAGNIDDSKMVLAGMVREAEMFGTDEPKRSVVGVGTDVEFATDLIGLIKAVGYTPPDDLVFAATGERRAIEERNIIEGEVVEPTLDTESPEPIPRAAGGGASGEEPGEPSPPPPESPWSNL